MIRLGILNLIAGGLQLTVPPYALRLVRRWGAQRVGWFLVAAFMAMALMHLLTPLRPASNEPTSGFAEETVNALVYALGSVLLLVGMGHLETLFTERGRAERQEEKLRGAWELRVEEKAKACQELLQQLTRRQQTEATIAESEAQYRLLFIENPLPMLIFDLRSLRFLTVNQAALRLYGFSPQEFGAMTVRDLVPAEVASAFQQVAAQSCSRAEAKGQWRHRRKDRTLLDVELTAVDLKYANCPARLMTVQDTSERRRRELSEREAFKMQTLSQVAGGVGHHFNNLLAVIEGHASLLLNKPHDAQSTEQLKQICAAANRGAGITRQLAAAAGRQLINTEVLNLNGLILNLVPMLRRLVGQAIVLQNSSFSSLPPIMADPRVIEHILVNLVLNARDVMPAGGTLTISTATIRVDAAQAQRGHHAQAGEFVCLAVRDSGSGMPPDVQAHIFEPFFTTHEPGRTGLGLASIYGAARQHSGWAEFSSESGVGTEFRVYFPSAPASARVAKKEIAPALPPVHGTVLLVEPVERVRGLARFILNRRGYKVVEADSAWAALLLWEGQGSKIDLLLTDLSLTRRMTGRALAEKLRSSRAELKVVYTSDPEARGTGGEPLPSEEFRLVTKPLSPDKLLRAIEEALAAKGA